MPTADELGIPSVYDVLTGIYALEGTVRGEEFVIHCPNPGHIDRSPSCAVNLRTGLWNCFACSAVGDLLGLGRMIWRIPRQEVKNRISPHTPEALALAVRNRIENLIRADRPRPLAPVPQGPYEDGPLDELTERGFDEATLKEWGIRYVPEQELANTRGDPYTIRDSIGIPIRDSSGVLVAWCYRRTVRSPSWQARYLYSNRAVSGVWYGAERVHRQARPVIVEGALDTIWLHQHGYPGLGLLGAEMAQTKAHRLLNYPGATLFPDLDHAGIMWVRRLGHLLGHRMPLSVVRYPSWMPDRYGKKLDPAELSAVDLDICLARAVPWAVWSRMGYNEERGARASS